MITTYYHVSAFDVASLRYTSETYCLSVIQIGKVTAREGKGKLLRTFGILHFRMEEVFVRDLFIK